MLTTGTSDKAGLETGSVSAAPALAPTVDVVVPVYNEQAILDSSVESLCDYLRAGFPFSWRVTVVDNASTDATPEVSRELARRLPGVRLLRLDRRGRGLALRAAWSQSDADVVVYMDADLSTRLDALLPLVAPLLSGHSDVAIGSRLAAGASVARYPKRELLSRGYNLLLRAVFATQVSDAQCGFKAVRRTLVGPLLGAVEDDGWFFDTELLLIAERNGLRIHEVPVDWTDDPDSRVDLGATVAGDLRGVMRLAWRFATGNGKVELGAAERAERRDDFGRGLVSFAAIGFMSTAASLLLFLATRSDLGAIRANALAVSATFWANTWANARFTHRRSGPAWGLAAATYLGALLLTSAALTVAHSCGGGRLAEVVALGVTWPVATLARLLVGRRAMRSGVREDAP